MMKSRRSTRLLLCALGLLLSTAAGFAPRILSAQSSELHGAVINMATGEPIAGAEIQAAGQTTRTDSQGRYRLMLAPGAYGVSARAPNYIGMTHTRVSVSERRKTELDFEMIPLHPSADDSVLLDGRLRQLSQAGPSALEREALATGYTPSLVTQVPQSLRVLMPDGSVVVMEMDEYLKGVVPHEVPARWPRQSLLAQAVAARSVAATSHRHEDQGADICTTVHCQVWGATHYDTTDEAVDSTHGEAISHSGSIVYAYFFGHCDGDTRDSEDVWWGALPYCRSVSCPCGFDELWGHGVGMCQEGARELALQGRSYGDILRYYYTGVTIARSDTGGVIDAFVHPTSGDENTQFTYEAHYASSLGDVPASAHVIIDGRTQSLSRVAVDTGVSIFRLISQLSAGQHDYRFYFDDGYGNVSTVPPAGTALGPSVVAPDPVVPTPTRMPSTPSGLVAYDHTASTISDWSAGTLEGLQVTSAGDGALALPAERTQGVYHSPAITVPWVSEALGVTWHAQIPAGATLALEVQSSLDGQTWTPWRLLEPAEDGPIRHNSYSSDLVLGRASVFRYRVALAEITAGALPQLEQIHVVCLTTQAVEPSSAWAKESPRPTVAEPDIVARAGWGADESIMTWPADYRHPQAIILHHTGMPLNGVDPSVLVRSLYYYDAVVRQRGDLGYNYLVDPQGKIYEGRAGGFDVVGSHAGRFDWGSIGIALIGDYGQESVTSEALDSLTDLLAWRCAELYIDPMQEQATFIDQVLPTVMSHRDCEATTCAGDALQALLPTIRQRALEKMQQISPHLEIVAPSEDSYVHAVVRPELNASAVVTKVTYYVDGAPVGHDEGLPGTWRWDTLTVNDGPHTLRIAIENAVGIHEDQVQVTVDNTVPGGTVSAPRWIASPSLSLSLQSDDAVSVLLSNDWVWEGEALLHPPDSGREVPDSQALNGLAWQGLGGVDAPGGWYGPYTCDLPSWTDYVICFRIKVADATLPIGLATLDVVDDQGRRKYAQRALAANDLVASDRYEDVCLELPYQGRWPTCDDPEVQDGLEFRLWFSAAGDLYLDRATAYEGPVSMQDALVWSIPDREGDHRILARLLDQAGNSLDSTVSVYLDKTTPAWSQAGPAQYCARDIGAGLESESAMWSSSADGTATWSEWSSLGLDPAAAGSEELCWGMPSLSGTHIRFRIADRANNTAISQAYAVDGQTPVAPTPTASITPAPTVPVTVQPPTWTPDPAQNHKITLPLVFQ